MLEALKQTANPIDWMRLQSVDWERLQLRLFGVGPTPNEDRRPDEAPRSILPGRVDDYYSSQTQGLDALRKAARPLRSELVAGALHSTGIPFGTNGRVSILSDLWRGFILNFGTSSVEDNGGRRFDGVRIYSASVPAGGELIKVQGGTTCSDAAASEHARKIAIAERIMADAKSGKPAKGFGKEAVVSYLNKQGDFGGLEALRDTWDDVIGIPPRGRLTDETYTQIVGKAELILGVIKH
jgi:hypothetical protein